MADFALPGEVLKVFAVECIPPNLTARFSVNYTYGSNIMGRRLTKPGGHEGITDIGGGMKYNRSQ